MRFARIVTIFLAAAVLPLMVYAASTSISFSAGSRYVDSAKGHYIKGTVSQKAEQYVCLYNSKGKLKDYKKTDMFGKFSFNAGTLKKGNNVFYVRSLKKGDVNASSTYKITLNYADCYYVKFNAMGGKGTMATQKIQRGKSVRLAANKFTREGYTFVGWAKAQDRPIMAGTNVSNFKNVNMGKFQLGKRRYTNGYAVKNLAPANTTITLYAVWKGSGPAAAVDWAKLIANDNRFQYGTGQTAHQTGCFYCGTNVGKKGSRYKMTYCCNPFITAAYVHGANIKNWCGSIDGQFFGGMIPRTWTCYNSMPGHKGVFRQVSKSNLKNGDILMSDGHVWMAVSGGRRIEAGSEGWTARSISMSNGTRSGSANYVMRYYPR